jgi:Xaa-Pro aminopeptidase
MPSTRRTFAPELSAAPPLPTREEYVERQERTRAALVEAELDGLLAFGSHTWPWAVRWLADYQSGFNGSSIHDEKGWAAVVLPVEGDPIVVIDQRGLPGELAIEDARTVTKGIEGVAGALRDSGLLGKRIGIAGEGVMLDRHRRGIESELGAELPLVPADSILEPLTRVKSPAELDCLRYSNAVGSAWMKAMMEAVEPGRTEADLVLAGLPVLLKGGGFPTDVVAGSGNPARPQAPRGIPSFNCERKLEAGDLLRLDCLGPVRSYGCDMARSTCVGAAPTEPQLIVLEQAIEFVETLIAAVAPGVTHERVHDVGTAWMLDHGYPPHGYFEGFWHAFGHQMGLTTEGPHISPDETDPIVAGQVLALEIVVGTPETGGISHEEVIIVHEDENEMITASCPQRWW